MCGNLLLVVTSILDLKAVVTRKKRFYLWYMFMKVSLGECNSSHLSGDINGLDNSLYNNNIPSVNPHVGSGEGGVYLTLPLPCKGREAVSIVCMNIVAMSVS